MAIIHNSSLTKELIDVVKLQTSTDIVPNQIADKVVPVIDVNPKHSRITNVVKSGLNGAINTTVAIYTTPADKDFFLTGWSFSVLNGATSQATNCSIKLTPFDENVTTEICGITNVTGVTSVVTFSNSLDTPMKLKRGTAINNVIGGAAVGDCKTDASIWGFYIDNSSA